MANITRIDLEIKTGNRTGAGTDGFVYLGIGGREFRVDRPNINDLEKNTTEIFVFSPNGTVVNPTLNDPTSPYKLKTEDLDKFPRYIRFRGAGDDDNWNIEQLKVTVNPGASEKVYEALGGSNNVWLGARNGEFFYFN